MHASAGFKHEDTDNTGPTEKSDPSLCVGFGNLGVAESDAVVPEANATLEPGHPGHATGSVPTTSKR